MTEQQNGTNEAAKDERLISFIERIERLEEEKKELAGDIREVYAEAKGANYDAKIIRQVIRLRKMDPSEREENEFLLDEYKRLTGL
mgnify:CR=1 FL=1